MWNARVWTVLRMRRLYSLKHSTLPNVSVNGDSKGPDQPARMRRLIWAFAVHICPKIHFCWARIHVIQLTGKLQISFGAFQISNDLMVYRRTDWTQISLRIYAISKSSYLLANISKQRIHYDQTADKQAYLCLPWPHVPWDRLWGLKFKYVGCYIRKRPLCHMLTAKRLISMIIHTFRSGHSLFVDIFQRVYKPTA